MALTTPTDPMPFDEEQLNGHTIEELSDYLDRGRAPADPSIDESPECQLALGALERLRSVSNSLIETEATAMRPPADDWVRGILSNITREVRAGRSIPLDAPSPSIVITQTEGAVRALIRAAGDSVPGALLGRCSLIGDVTVAGEPITIALAVTAIGPIRLPDLARRVREAVSSELTRHTELVVAGIDVTIQDIQLDLSGRGEGQP